MRLLPRPRCTAALAAAAALMACGGVKVKPSGDGVRPEPRPKGCSLEFLQKAPGRPYQEIADLEAHVTSPPSGGALEVLRDKACELGADAVIVSRNFVTNEQGHVLVAGTAIKYVEQPPSPELERPSEEKAVPGTVDL
jgi:hypothetical protein